MIWRKQASKQVQGNEKEDVIYYDASFSTYIPQTFRHNFDMLLLILLKKQSIIDLSSVLIIFSPSKRKIVKPKKREKNS